MHETPEAPEMTYVATSGMKNSRPLLSRASRPTRSQANSQVTAAVSDSSTPEAAPYDEGLGDEVDLRQLRHHTKNTLQRIIGLLSEIPGLTDTPAGEQMAR